MAAVSVASFCTAPATSTSRASSVNLSSAGRVSVSKAFGVRASSARVSCSVEEDVKSFVKNCADAGKLATVALAASALAVSGANAEGSPQRLTYDEIQEQTYLQVKGSGTANQCPILKEGVGQAGLSGIKPGDYKLKKFCLEPTSFTVKAEGLYKGTGDEFQKTKLMTRLTYTLDEIEGDLKIGGDGAIKLVETGGIDYAAVTVQLPGRERVPFLFTVKELVATGKADGFSGTFLVPSYRGSSFLDPKGRGGSTGYDNAVALPAGGRGDEEDLSKENEKNTEPLKGNITFKVAKNSVEDAEIVGVFESIQPSDTDLGSKAPKDVKIEGIWYAQYE